jgi:hypothetical protein
MFQTDSTNRYGCYALLPQTHGSGVPYLVTDTNIFPETLSLIYALLISNKARGSKGILDCSSFFLPMSHH